jgi:hypothetical protein
MGYYSDVALIIDESVPADSLNPAAFELLKNGFQERRCIGVGRYVRYYYWSSIKWHNTYPDVAGVMKLLSIATAMSELEKRPLFGLVRLGEEFSDVELAGDPHAYGLSVSREILWEV